MTAQYRFLPALHWAREQLRTKRYDWVAIVDDDSFVFPRALQRLLQRYDSSRAYYFGDFLGDDALLLRCAVDELVHEETLASAPVDQEVLRQKRRGDHADAIVHPSRGCHLSHAVACRRCRSGCGT